MSLPAFWLPGQWGRECVLTGDEAHHFQILRIRPGEKILILDGKGKTGLCHVREIKKREIILDLEREWDTPEPKSKPVIAIALSKAVRRGFFLEKAAELGAWAVWLWQAERSQGKLTDKLAETSAAQIRAGAKQCHNPWFPQVRVLAHAESVAKAAQECPWRLLPWEEKADQPIISEIYLGREGETVYAIGPEGGMTKAEADCFEAFGFATISLGSRILRCETAATLILGLHYWASQMETR